MPTVNQLVRKGRKKLINCWHSYYSSILDNQKAVWLYAGLLQENLLGFSQPAFTTLYAFTF